MELFNPFKEKKEAIHTKVVWNVMDDDDKILLILPDIRPYHPIENETILQQFRLTIHEILDKKPIHTVLYIDVPNPLTDHCLRQLEGLLGTELQWLHSLDHLENETFMEHHHPKKVYLLQEKLYHYPIMSNHFTKAIIDTLVIEDNRYIPTMLEEAAVPLHNGVCFLEETINLRVFLNKLMTQLNTPFHKSRHRSEEYDVAFIIGKLEENELIDIESLIKRTIQKDQCSMVFSCNETISKNLAALKKEFRTKIPLIDYELPILDSDVTHELVGRMERISKSYTTFLFIGKFEFGTPEAKVIWEKHRKYLENCSIFDPFAYDVLIGKHKNTYRLTKEMGTLIDIFLRGEFDNLGNYDNEKTKKKEVHIKDTKEDEDDEEGKDDSDWENDCSCDDHTQS